MTRRVVLAAVLGVSVFPSTAAGSTAFMEVDEGSRRLYYVASPGEANQVEMSEAGGIVTIRDSGAVIVADPECVQIDAHEVRCAEQPFSLVFLDDLDDAATIVGGPVLVFGESGDDEITSPTDCTCNVSIRGGDGNDLLTSNGNLYGDAGNDTITGGDGINGIDGGAGDDTIDGGGRGDAIDPGLGNDSVDGGPAPVETPLSSTAFKRRSSSTSRPARRPARGRTRSSASRGSMEAIYPTACSGIRRPTGSMADGVGTFSSAEAEPTSSMDRAARISCAAGGETIGSEAWTGATSSTVREATTASRPATGSVTSSGEASG